MEGPGTCGNGFCEAGPGLNRQYELKSGCFRAADIFAARDTVLPEAENYVTDRDPTA